MDEANALQPHSGAMIAFLSAKQEIGREHERLASMLAEARTARPHDACRQDCRRCASGAQGACEERLGTCLSDLLGYMCEHFAHEETLMRGLPRNDEVRAHCAAHKLAHADMSERLADVVRLLGAVTPVTSRIRLLTLIERWLVDHIENEDRVLLQLLASAAQPA